jgi:hypothetical protein
LLIRRNPFLILNFCFYIFNTVTRLHVQCNRLSSQSLYKDLHCFYYSSDTIYLSHTSKAHGMLFVVGGGQGG